MDERLRALEEQLRTTQQRLQLAEARVSGMLSALPLRDRLIRDAALEDAAIAAERRRPCECGLGKACAAEAIRALKSTSRIGTEAA